MRFHVRSGRSMQIPTITSDPVIWGKLIHRLYARGLLSEIKPVDKTGDWVYHPVHERAKNTQENIY